jgi:PKD repeat protein
MATKMLFMKKTTLSYAIALLSIASLFTQCKKDDLSLTGNASQADFTFTQVPGGDSLPYTPQINFTSTAKDAFIHQWSFGDNLGTSPEINPQYKYRKGGVYNVTLTTVGTNGNNAITKVVNVTDACSNDFFSKLTNCAIGEWTWSTDGDAIRVLSPDATQVYFAGAASGCQADDVYKFNADGTFTYEANGQTLDVQAGYSCQAPKLNATSFKVVARTGQLPRIVLPRIATGRPFIGTTDVVDSNLYRIMSYTDNTMTLRATIEGSGGTILEVKLKKVVVLTIADIKNILTGGSSKTWRLDPTPGANAIIVGTENNPAQYFGGGPLDPSCQTDDTYTFNNTNVIYNANGATFNGGNIAPNYNCGADRSFNVAYTYGANTSGFAGLATIQLPQAPPVTFIGTTDVPTENMYRIIEITPTRLVLRAGNGTGTVFQFKFIPL